MWLLLRATEHLHMPRIKGKMDVIPAPNWSWWDPPGPFSHLLYEASTWFKSVSKKPLDVKCQTHQRWLHLRTLFVRGPPPPCVPNAHLSAHEYAFSFKSGCVQWGSRLLCAHQARSLARTATAFHVQAPSGPPVLPDMRVGKGLAWLALASRQNSPRPSKATGRRIEQCLTFADSKYKQGWTKGSLPRAAPCQPCPAPRLPGEH